MRIARRTILRVVSIGALAAVTAACNGQRGSVVPSRSSCNLQSRDVANGQTDNYRLVVGLAPSRRIRPASGAGSIAVEVVDSPSRALSAVGTGRVHFDVLICTTAGRPLSGVTLPSVRLSDAAVRGMTINVPLQRLKLVSDRIPPHFGANITLPVGDPIRASIQVAGETASVALPGST